MLNVWKNVKRYAADGFTSIIHGKHWHEETRATASQAVQASGGHYLVVLDSAEADAVCDFITSAPAPGRPGARRPSRAVPRRLLARVRSRPRT